MINQLYINTNKKITHTLLLKCIYVIDNELTLRSSLNYYYSFVYFFGRFKCRNLFNMWFRLLQVYHCNASAGRLRNLLNLHLVCLNKNTPLCNKRPVSVLEFKVLPSDHNLNMHFMLQC